MAIDEATEAAYRRERDAYVRMGRPERAKAVEEHLAALGVDISAEKPVEESAEKPEPEDADATREAAVRKQPPQGRGTRERQSTEK